VQAYGFTSGSKYPTSASGLPSDSDVEQYKALASHFGELDLYENDGKYYAVKPAETVQVGGQTLSMKIDLGGIGKGYAVDKIRELYDEKGFEYGYISFGTSSVGLFRHSTQGRFTLGLNSPRTLFGDNYMTLKVNDVNISTSGDYEQYYEIDGVRYCHIIDPTTGKPVQTGIYTATVIGGSAAEDDAYTTAIMTMGKDKAIEFINSKLKDRLVAFTCNK
jgi:thiamine biosynthesis lipoprotein